MKGSLSVLTSQLGTAANISTQLSLKADTPKLDSTAAKALGLVGKVEAKAEAVLTAELSSVSTTEQDALLKADLQVTEGREFALSTLTKLSGVSAAQVDAAKREITGLAGVAKSLLVQLVAQTTATPSGCGSLSAFEQLVAASIPADVKAALDPAGASAATLTKVDAGGSLLMGIVSHEVVQTQVTVQHNASTTCGDSDNVPGTGSVNASGNLLLGLSL